MTNKKQPEQIAYVPKGTYLVKNKEDSNTWKILFITLLIAILLGTAIYYVQSEVTTIKDQSRYEGAVRIIEEQTATGNIYFLENSTGTPQVQNLPIKTICANIAGAGQQ